MKPSIIRRFAKYHGVVPPKNWPLTIEYIRGAMADPEEAWRHPGAIEAARDALIQSLTRIEDAEMLIAEVGAVTSVSDGPAFPRVRARLDILANELLVQAGIKDPQRWREVKE